MNEVGAACARALVTLAGLPGVDILDSICAGLSFDAPALAQKSRVDWDEYCTMFERLEVATGGLVPLDDLLARAYHVAIPAEFRTLFGAFISPKTLYRFMMEVIDPPLFANVDFRYEDLGNDWVRLSMSVREPSRPCAAFIWGSIGAGRGATGHLGLPLARCEIEHADGRTLRQLVYVPDPPQVAQQASYLELRAAAEQLLADFGDLSVARWEESQRYARLTTLGRDLAAQPGLPALADTLLAALERHGFSASALIVHGTLERRFVKGSGPFVRRVPLTSGDAVIATIEVSDGDTSIIEALAPWIAMSIENARARPSAEDASRMLELTARQSQVFAHLIQGASNKEIAATLACAENTVELHVSHILRKAGVTGRAQLMARFWAGSLRGSA